jgi:hypothetical protein
MKSARIALASLVVVMSALLGSAQARAGQDPRVGIFSDIRVEKGEVLHDDVVCIGGHATVEGKVEGSVVVIGGGGRDHSQQGGLPIRHGGTW